MAKIIIFRSYSFGGLVYTPHNILLTSRQFIARVTQEDIANCSPFQLKFANSTSSKSEGKMLRRFFVAFLLCFSLSAVAWALTQSYGNDKNDISLKGYSEYGQVIKLLDNKIEMLRATRKTNLPSPEQCSAVSESDYSKLVDAMHKQ